MWFNRRDEAGRMYGVFAALMAFITACSLISCSKKTSAVQIAVFVPGIMADSPIYAMLADGSRDAVDSYNTNTEGKQAVLTISEAGTNQSDWGTLLTALAAEQKYDVIISSNPSLPALIEPIMEQFPAQRFILLDADLSGRDAAASVHFDQKQQAYLAGYTAALTSATGRLALIAAQEYPVMNDVIYPAFAKGAGDASGATVDFAVVGNWYDATKGAAIAKGLIDGGVDVILPIAGGAGQGVIAASKEAGTKVVLFDSADFFRCPEAVAACATIDMTALSCEMTSAFLDGNVAWGTSRTVGVQDGYVHIVLSPNADLVSNEVREKVNALAAKMGA